MRLTVLAVGLWGCAAPSADPTAPPPDEADATVEDATAAPPTPEELRDEAVAVTEAGLRTLFEFDLDAIEQSYYDAMTLGDAQCPTEYLGYWAANCDASTGATFDGFAFEFADDDPDYGYWAVYGEAMIGRPDGGWITLAGYAGWGTYQVGSLHLDYHYAFGTFQDDGAENWLGDEHEVGIYVEAGSGVTGAHHWLADGTLGTIDGERGHALDFDLFALNEPGYEGTLCPDDTAPSGVIWARTRSADWVQVTFGDRCDGCADLYLEGESLGEACFDLDYMLDWEVTPW